MSRLNTCLPPASEEKAKEMALDHFHWNEVNRSVQWNSNIVGFEVSSKDEKNDRGIAMTPLVDQSEANLRERKMEPQYPTILRRYMATVIDGILVISLFILSSYVLPQDSEVAVILRIGIVFAMFFVYEPLFTSRFCTLGQKVMRIRVKKRLGYKKISIPSAYIRIVVKLLLGILSFFTIPFTDGRKAIHDFVAGSVVICANSH